MKTTDQPSVSSLVVCPPTLTGHWCYEVEKFCSPEHLSTLHYTGGPAERQRSVVEVTTTFDVLCQSGVLCEDCGRCYLNTIWLLHHMTLSEMTLSISGN